MTDGAGDLERPEPKTETLGGGDEVVEADDCRFIASPSGTVHERAEWPGSEYGYGYHPRCGQRLPEGSMWSKVDAETPEEVAESYGLWFCAKCFGRSWELNKLSMEARSEGVTRLLHPDSDGDDADGRDKPAGEANR